MEETDLIKNLKEWFNFDRFRAGQKESIETILNGENTLAILPTGTGKSLIYEYCGYATEGLVLIVSPLLSLMDNQVLQLNQAGEKRAAALNSMLNLEERRLIEKRLDYYKFLFVSPEMLQSKWLVQRLSRLKIALFVVDEAHCISQWGLDFRPDYLYLGKIREELNNPLTLALTATAPQEVIDDILKTLNLDPTDTAVYQSNPNRENIYYDFREIEDNDKDTELLQLINDFPNPGIIYFSSKVKAEQICQLLRENTEQAVDTYHADRSIEDRKIIQRQFLNGELDIICATTAFGMGINKKNIRFIIHYHIPNSIEEYLQETGRAGRDGLQSIAVLLYSKSDAVFKFKKMKETQLNDNIITMNDKNESLEPWGLSDSDLAMLQVIKARHLSKEQAKSLINQRLEKRISKFVAMGQLATQNRCKREMMSVYFSQKSNPVQIWCCSFCQSDIQSLVEEMQLISQPKKIQINYEKKWDQVIKELFIL